MPTNVPKPSWFDVSPVTVMFSFSPLELVNVSAWDPAVGAFTVIPAA